MIRHVRFRNFKALRDVDVEFDGPLTVLVGPNGSGKTSVLRGIDWLLLLGAGVPFDDAADMRDDSAYLLFPPEDYIRLELVGTPIDGGSVAGVRAEFSRPTEAGERQHPGSEVAVFNTNDDTGGQWEPTTTRTTPKFGLASFVQLDPKALAAATYPTGGYPTLTGRGEGLASALAALALNDPDLFQRVVTHLKEIVPNVRRVRFNRFDGNKQERETPATDDSPSPVVQLRTRKHIMESLLFDLTTATGVHASEISDGTLLILGVLTIIYLFPKASVVLLDDIDHGLHPRAQTQFVELLRRVMGEFPRLQFIATSHSPYILDQLTPSEVRVSTLREDGTAAIARLDEHPEFDKWKDAMTPGEFWTHAGEDWVKKLPARVAQ